MAMRWENGSPERKIEAFIGAWGVKTGDIVDTDHLLELASRIFEVENTGLPDRMMAAIDALGPKGRRAKAQKNIEAVMGDAGRFSPDWGKEFREQQAHAALDQAATPAALHRMMDNSKPDMIDGEPFDCVGELDIDPAQLLRKVVSAVISAGRADILWEFPEVLAFFGSRIPQREEVAHLHNVDQRMFDAADKWPNRKPRA
ncbi:hypothetical protein ATER59S_02374 [Aquamicrobium terrae]